MSKGRSECHVVIVQRKWMERNMTDATDACRTVLESFSTCYDQVVYITPVQLVWVQLDQLLRSPFKCIRWPQWRSKEQWKTTSRLLLLVAGFQRPCSSWRSLTDREKPTTAARMCLSIVNASADAQRRLMPPHASRRNNSCICHSNETVTKIKYAAILQLINPRQIARDGKYTAVRLFYD